MTEQPSTAQSPLPVPIAVLAVVRCIARTAAMLVRRRVHLPRDRTGARLRFADGTSAVVYRETAADRAPGAEPCMLVVAFRLRLVRGRGHAAFRMESILNTLLFVGFPGFVSKLWLAHDQRDCYRGIYEWDGAAAAEYYARSLWRVLAIVSTPGSIRYTVLPHVRRADLLAGAAPPDPSGWWQVIARGDTPRR